MTSCLAMARLATHLDCPRSNSRGSSAGTGTMSTRADGHRRTVTAPSSVRAGSRATTARTPVSMARAWASL